MARVKMNLNLTIIFVLIMAASLPVSAQKKAVRVANFAPCTLTLKEAPKLRGFYLGESVNEISKIFPTMKREYSSDNSYNYYANPNSDYRIVVLSPSDDEVYNSDEYKDVGITWHFYNGILTQLFVTYTEYMPGSLNNFIKQTSEKTNIPATSFRKTDKHKAIAACTDFSLELWEGQDSRIGWSPNDSTIVLADTKKITQLEKDRIEYEAQKKADARRKKQEELNRRTTLKP